MAKQKFQSVRGMYDVLPSEEGAFQYAQNLFAQLCQGAGYHRIDTPLVEDAAVFQRGVGNETDIVEKELYNFPDRSGNQLALRPEPTAGIVRAYIEHGMGSWPQPVKLFTSGPMFRYDRPQAGRQRQFYQLDVEIFGEAAPSADAQVITLANRFLKKLGLAGYALQVNSIGDAACRPKYKKVLIEYLEAHQSKLGQDCQKRLKSNPLRVLDCKEASCQPIIAAAPQTLNHLCKACQAHFTGVLEYLDDLGIAYELNPLLVRGLDYYTRTVFEFYGAREGSQSALGGGGRYDGLVELLGGQPTPGVGFGLGIERLWLELQADNVALPESKPVKVFVASLGEPARLAAFRLIEQLLDADVGATGAVDKNGIGTQLGRADRLGVPYALIIGQKEVVDKTIILRDMSSGAQEMIPLAKIVGELQRRFR